MDCIRDRPSDDDLLQSRWGWASSAPLTNECRMTEDRMGCESRMACEWRKSDREGAGAGEGFCTLSDAHLAARKCASDHEWVPKLDGSGRGFCMDRYHKRAAENMLATKILEARNRAWEEGREYSGYNTGDVYAFVMDNRSKSWIEGSYGCVGATGSTCGCPSTGSDRTSGDRRMGGGKTLEDVVGGCDIDSIMACLESNQDCDCDPISRVFSVE